MLKKITQASKNIIEQKHNNLLLINLLKKKYLQTIRGNCIKTIIFNYTNCEYSEIDSLSPLRTVVPFPSNQAQTIEFLKRVGKQFKCNS